ncbi:MAG TPA: hypothetical protein VM598_05215, partial [Bdellovibrionota bacterium]|nr:hypothetical protein [Bdellovibrionota bacterium]
MKSAVRVLAFAGAFTAFAQDPSTPPALKPWQIDFISNVGIGFDVKSQQGGTLPRMRFDAIRFEVDPETGKPFPATVIVARGDLRPFLINVNAAMTEGCIQGTLAASGQLGDTSPDLGQIYTNCKAGADLLTNGQVKGNQALREIYVTQKVAGNPTGGAIYFSVGKLSPEYFDFQQPSPVHHRISSVGARMAYRKYVGEHIFSIGLETFADEMNKLYFPYGDDLAGYNIAYSQALVQQGVKLNDLNVGQSQEIWVRREKRRQDPRMPAESFLLGAGSRNAHRANYVVGDVQNHFKGLFVYSLQAAYEQYGGGHFLDDPSKAGPGREIRAHAFAARPITRSILVAARYVVQAARGTTSPSFQYFEPGLLFHIWDGAKSSGSFSVDAFA